MDVIPANILADAQESAGGYIYEPVDTRYMFDDTTQYVLGEGQTAILPLNYDVDELGDDEDLPTVTIGAGSVVDIVDMGGWYRIYGAQTPEGVQYGLSST